MRVVILLLYILFSTISNIISTDKTEIIQMTGKFLYFAYGSNLLSKRIHINNPTAVRKTIGKLDNYGLDFNGPATKRWGGCPATIVPDENQHVWGAVWEIDDANLEDLDRQEGVKSGVYFPLEVSILSPHNGKIKCRSYQLCATPPRLPEGETLPPSRQPSKIYLDVILQGAQESGLPEEYISKLKLIPHNGYIGQTDVF